MLLIFRRKSYRRKRDNFAKYIKASAAAGAMTPEAWSAAPALVYRKVTSKRIVVCDSETDLLSIAHPPYLYPSLTSR